MRRCVENRLGHGIRRRPRTEVEPDLFVSQAVRDYDRAPTPILVVEVLPGGEDRFQDLQLLLNESGLDIQRRQAQPGAQQAVRPTNPR